MKTLIINGSPRKNGVTSSLVRQLKKQLKGDSRIVETYYEKISPCTDCRYCWEHKRCAINDDMQGIYDEIDRCDNIVIASPIYFAELTGPLLSWASRLQYFWIAKNFRKEPAISQKPRKGAVILVDGGEGNVETALAMGKRLLRIMGAQYLGHVYFSGTDTLESSAATISPAILKEIDDLSKQLNG